MDVSAAERRSESIAPPCLRDSVVIIPRMHKLHARAVLAGVGVYNVPMPEVMKNAQDVLEQYYLEMRWRCLSLAADLDRVERAAGGAALLNSDARLTKLREAFGILSQPGAKRAEKVQLIFSDKTPPPK
jgi:hypothetical protein